MAKRRYNQGRARKSSARRHEQVVSPTAVVSGRGADTPSDKKGEARAKQARE